MTDSIHKTNHKTKRMEFEELIVAIVTRICNTNPDRYFAASHGGSGGKKDWSSIPFKEIVSSVKKQMNWEAKSPIPLKDPFVENLTQMITKQLDSQMSLSKALLGAQVQYPLYAVDSYLRGHDVSQPMVV
jgi:hypothetical protein